MPMYEMTLTEFEEREDEYTTALLFLLRYFRQRECAAEGQEMGSGGYEWRERRAVVREWLREQMQGVLGVAIAQGNGNATD